MHGFYVHILLTLSINLIILLGYKLVNYIRVIRNGLRDMEKSEKELIDKFKFYK